MFVNRVHHYQKTFQYIQTIYRFEANERKNYFMKTDYELYHYCVM